MKRLMLIVLFCSLVGLATQAQEIKNNDTEIKKIEKQEFVAPDSVITKSEYANPKKGLSFGPIPAVAFDADKGFEYGAILNIYNFGDGSKYPNPISSWYIEAAAYTRGSQQYILSYDKKDIFPGTRLCASANVVYDKALPFYGFNGYEAIYDPEKDKKGGFYRMTRLTPNFKVDLIGEITDNLYWEAGYHFTYFKTSLFESEDANSQSLLNLYNKWGIIPDSQMNGGVSSAIRFGVMYDSRDVENSPSRGIWAEAHAIVAPSFLGTTHPYNKINATFRHYIPVASDKLVFAYRLNYQGFIGNAPWYVLPYYTIVGPNYDRTGIGGYRTVRGLKANRVQGAHTGFFNTELRWRFVDFTLFNQNISLALSGFFDGAKVIKGIENSNKTGAFADEYSKYIQQIGYDKLHMSAGAGFRFIMNRNFIVALEYARCLDAQDGSGAFYINTGFLF